MAEHCFEWTVPDDHPAFPGHFPGRPIVPGVVLLDQAIRCADQLDPTAGGRWQIGQAKFLSPVEPGETLCFALQARASGGFSFVVRASGRDVASGTLTPPAA